MPSSKRHTRGRKRKQLRRQASMPVHEKPLPSCTIDRKRKLGDNRSHGQVTATNLYRNPSSE